MDTNKYQEFAKEKLGFEFNDINLLVVALTHRSYVNEHKSAHEHNERLEFLGDAVLELVSSDFLYRKYDYPEGVMTALRAALVRTESIGQAGVELGYEPLRSEEHTSELQSHTTISYAVFCFFNGYSITSNVFLFTIITFLVMKRLLRIPLYKFN